MTNPPLSNSARSASSFGAAIFKIKGLLSGRVGGFQKRRFHFADGGRLQSDAYATTKTVRRTPRITLGN